MGKALEDIGLNMLKVTVVLAVTLEHSGLQGANMVVAIQLNNGMNFNDNHLMSTLGFRIEHFCISCCFCYALFRYHVPRSWLKPSQNLLVIFEELGGDASKVALVKRSVTTVCAKVSDQHPSNWHNESISQEAELMKPMLSLHCTDGYSISAIKFASFGTPSGSCGNFQHGTCHAPGSRAALEKVLGCFLISVFQIFIKAWILIFPVTLIFRTA